MSYGDVADYLSTFIDYDELNEEFDYSFNLKSTNDIALHELHKFNKVYKSFFFYQNRLVYMINNYEIVLKKDDLNQMINLYLYFKDNNKNNTYLIAEFLLSYYNTISSQEYAKNVKNSKKIKDEFRDTISSFSQLKKPIIEFYDLSYELYNRIIDYSIKNEDVFIGDILDRLCINMKLKNDKKNIIIEKLLKNSIYPMTVIKYDNMVKCHVDFYERYITDILKKETYYNYPENILYILNNKKILKKEILNLVLNDIITKINIIQDKSTVPSENFIQILSEIDEIIKLINRFLNKLVSIESEQVEKMHECLNNILYIKRMVVADTEKMNSQMQEFTYEQTIPNKKISEFVESINKNIGSLYGYSSGNFTKRLNQSLENYSKYPISYVFNSFSIDSEAQIYQKSDDGIENSIFKKYYDTKGKEYTENHSELRNILTKDYYNQLIKYMRNSFISEQKFMISFFDIKEGKNSLIDKLIKKGNYVLKNNYIILAENVIAIESIIIKIMNNKNLNYTKSGFSNLNVLAKEYYSDDIYFNGLMYINYILYEKQGLNIRNNISHGNYFKRNIEVELLTTFCALMFLNNLLRKECG